MQLIYANTPTNRRGSSLLGLILLILIFSIITIATRAQCVVVAPTQSATGLSTVISGSSVSGSFTSPSAAISGYIVLRYVGAVASAANPVNNTSYTVGNTIGTNTVAAIVPSSSTGTRSFSDVIPAGSCNKSVFYRIFSYNGSGACIKYFTASPLLDNTLLSNPTPSIAASGPTTFCAGGSVTLTASGGTSYSWSTGVSTAAITATTSATYTVTATNVYGCTASASQVVTANSPGTITPYMNINNSGWNSVATATLCAGGQMEFGSQSSVGGTGGIWTISGPNGFYSYARDTTISNLQPIHAGTYTATYYNANGCNATQNYSININPSPVVTVNNPSACAGGTDTMIATGGGSYLWSTGATTSSIYTSTSGTYRVTVTNASGCTTTASGTATINAIPALAISVIAACNGSASTLTATGGNTYRWSNGAATAAITSTTAATYTVTAASAAGCTATLSASAMIYSPAVAVSSNSPVCVGSTINLTATASGSNSYTYAWSGPSSFSSTAANPSKPNAVSTDSGSYTITITDNHGCTVAGTTSVNVNGNCADSTTVGYNGGNSSDAPCTQILRFDHYNDAVAATASGQVHTWKLMNGNILTMTIKRTAGNFTSVVAPTWSGAAFGQSGYFNLTGKTVLYTAAAGYAKLTFSNITMKDSLGNAIPNFTLIGIDGESTDGAERDTLTSNGSAWYDYDTITPPSVGSVPQETGIGTNTLVWKGTGPVNARARLVSTQNPTNFTFSTVAGGLQGFAMAVANPILASSAVTICSNSSFSNTPRNFPTGTTYTWSAPVISPLGSITGASAQNSPVASVGQTLVNTTNADATITYNVVPSNACSSLGYTFTVTVKPSPTATVTATSPVCSGTTATISAMATGGGPLTYSWSGPAAFSSTSGAFSLTNAASSMNGTYTVVFTGVNSCTSSASTGLSVVNCLSVSGAIFDDANGNGTIEGPETKTSNGQTLYSILADASGNVISTGIVASDGSYTLNNVLPSTSGMTLRISTSNQAVGTPAGSASWPANWIGTLGQYGTNNTAGTGVYATPNQPIPVSISTTNISNANIGYDRLAAPTNQSFSVAHPAKNAIQTISAASGLANVTWTDPEDGSNIGSLVITDLSKMNGNTLFYDANSSGAIDAGEMIAAGRVISSFNPAKLKMKFTGLGSANATFSFSYIDLAGKTNPASSTYTVSWTGALPVKLISFTAALNTENKIDLDWATATEIDNDHFEVERSDDAANFTTIEQVKGAGNSTALIAYHTIDNNPNAGTSYYRLKQVDYDGKYTYSKVVSVTTEANPLDHSSISVFPTLLTNPSLHLVAAGFEAGTPVSISIVDLTGKIISHQYVATDLEGKNDISLSLPADMPFGIYIVACESVAGNYITKIVYSAK